MFIRMVTLKFNRFALAGVLKYVSLKLSTKAEQNY